MSPGVEALAAVLGFEAFLILVYAWLVRADRARGHLSVGKPRPRRKPPQPPP